MLLVQHCNISDIKTLLARFNLSLEITATGQDIPGSFWGEEEAGLIKNTLYVTLATPIHSLLHEACHYICMDDVRRTGLDTNAGGDYDEENAVCYLQIILSGFIAEMGQKCMFNDMDEWGYTFRLGSAQKWFIQDADDARLWLTRHKLIAEDKTCLFHLRSS